MLRIFMATIVLATALAACTEDETYPGSGDDCGPDDPVQTLDAVDCAAVPVAGSGGF